MHPGDAPVAAFPVGATAVRRDVFDGRIWTAAPYRAVADSGDELVLTCWPGVNMLATSMPIIAAVGWYVNFQLPYRRTAIGVDTFDLLLDLVVDADLSRYTWKDEDEYAHGRRLGLISAAVHAHVERSRQQIVALIAAHEGPFAQDWSGWRRDPEWPRANTSVRQHRSASTDVSVAPGEGYIPRLRHSGGS